MLSYILLIIVAAMGYLLWQNGEIDKFLDNVSGRRRPNDSNATTADMAKQIRGVKEELLSLKEQLGNQAATISELQTEIQSLITRMSQTVKTDDVNFHSANTAKETKWSQEPSMGKEFLSGGLIIGTTYYVTSPSGINPVRFKSESLNAKADMHYYTVHITDDRHAELGLVNDAKVIRTFLSSIAYQQNCVEIVSKPTGVPKQMQILELGQLKRNGNEWILKSKIKIKIV